MYVSFCPYMERWCRLCFGAWNHPSEEVCLAMHPFWRIRPARPLLLWDRNPHQATVGSHATEAAGQKSPIFWSDCLIAFCCIPRIPPGLKHTVMVPGFHTNYILFYYYCHYYILLLSLLSLLLFGFLLLFIATIRVLTVSLTVLQFLAAPCFKSRPWCSGCSRSRRKPLKVLGWKAPYPVPNETTRCDGCDAVLEWKTRNSNHLKAQRSPFSPMISWGAFPSFWDVPDMFDGHWDVHLESWNKHLWEATRTTPLRRTCWILSISRILQDSQWTYLKTILPNKGLKKRFMIGLIAWVSLVAPEWNGGSGIEHHDHSGTFWLVTFMRGM